MNTGQISKIISSNENETRNLGLKIGQKLQGGEVFLLQGDLGFGKTRFVKGVVEGAGIDEEVTSPSFTITNLYKGNEINIYHIDFYRLTEAGVMLHELKEITKDKSNVVLIEWPEIVKDKLPIDYIEIIIEDMGDTKRQFTIKYPEEKKYLFEGLN